jgi:hypothetical protein
LASSWLKTAWVWPRLSTATAVAENERPGLAPSTPLGGSAAVVHERSVTLSVAQLLLALPTLLVAVTPNRWPSCNRPTAVSV